MPLTARNESECCICGENISIGSNVRPYLDAKDAISWIHYGCINVAMDDPRIPLCRHYSKKGICMYQESCSFRHPKEYPKTLSMCSNLGGIDNRQRRGTRQRRKVFNDGKVGSLRRWLINVFGVDYLSSGSGVLDVAGGKGEVSFELLNLNGIPCTVIDPRELSLLRYQKKYSRGYYHRNEILRDHHTLSIRKEELHFISNPAPPFLPPAVSIAPVENDNTSSIFEGALSRTISRYRFTTKLPRHIRVYFHMDGINDRCAACVSTRRKGLNRVKVDSSGNTGGDDADDANGNILDGSMCVLPVFLHSADVFEVSRKESRLSSWTEKGLIDPSEDRRACVDDKHLHNAGEEEVGGDPCDVRSSSVYIYDGNELVVENHGTNEIQQYEDALKAVRDCSIVVGMHADQATEHLVDFALRNNKPFAILPCCIYSRQFPTRLSSSTGKLVTTYAQFIEYLLAKDPLGRIHAVELDFEGKNTLLYFVPNAVRSYETTNGDAIIDTNAVTDAQPRHSQCGVLCGAVTEIPPVILYQDPALPVARVVRGPATRAVWQALSDGLLRPDTDSLKAEE